MSLVSVVTLISLVHESTIMQGGILFLLFLLFTFSCLNWTDFKQYYDTRALHEFSSII